MLSELHSALRDFFLPCAAFPSLLSRIVGATLQQAHQSMFPDAAFSIPNKNDGFTCKNGGFSSKNAAFTGLKKAKNVAVQAV